MALRQLPGCRVKKLSMDIPVGCLVMITSLVIMLLAFVGAYHVLLWLAHQ